MFPKESPSMKLDNKILFGLISYHIIHNIIRFMSYCIQKGKLI